ncbi:hypothetical protein [Sporosarcina sp. Te-1]|uniref:hypothetical protein n=1 Tax=Sporosarcina sp. Te-1 TaxID=2818390 RepID=UPI001A9EBFA0|nr:hypothetical protein [Sporosarcina sp. Te-1]QTD43154.1 hypothetical protein J3U78_10620 [Sporosarcina sp. Te-1]
MFFNKSKNPYSSQQTDMVEDSDDTYPVILHFTPTAVYVYEDKTDSHVIQDSHIELWDDHGTVLSGTFIVTYVTSLQEAIEKYKVEELGLLVVPIELPS